MLDKTRKNNTLKKSQKYSFKNLEIIITPRNTGAATHHVTIQKIPGLVPSISFTSSLILLIPYNHETAIASKKTAIIIE